MPQAVQISGSKALKVDEDGQFGEEKRAAKDSKGQ